MIHDIKRLETQFLMASSYNMTYERLFAVVQQTYEASVADRQTVTAPTDTDPLLDHMVEGPLDEWEHILLYGDDHRKTDTDPLEG